MGVKNDLLVVLTTSPTLWTAEAEAESVALELAELRLMVLAEPGGVVDEPANVDADTEVNAEVEEVEVFVDGPSDLEFGVLDAP